MQRVLETGQSPAWSLYLLRRHIAEGEDGSPEGEDGSRGSQWVGHTTSYLHRCHVTHLAEVPREPGLAPGFSARPLEAHRPAGVGSPLQGLGPRPYLESLNW